jgi:predicted aspartyl protease
MSYPFKAKTGPVFVDAEISGPITVIGAKLILDTGATMSSINVAVLRSVGYDPASATDFTQVLTGTAATSVPRITLNRLSALGKHQIGLGVLAYDLPTAADADGLLGLDFLRDQILTIDFRAGAISLV